MPTFRDSLSVPSSRCQFGHLYYEDGTDTLCRQQQTNPSCMKTRKSQYLNSMTAKAYDLAVIRDLEGNDLGVSEVLFFPATIKDKKCHPRRPGT